MADEVEIKQVDVEGMSPEQILELAKEKGVELSDEQMDQIAGGVEGDWSPWIGVCPRCRTEHYFGRNEYSVICKTCGYKINWSKM